MAGKVLFVAYHYPPIAFSSGVHRTLAFTRYLTQWGWGVSVLTANIKLYPRYDLNQLRFIPPQVKVIRAWGKDAARDLSFKGKYAQWMAIPDRYQSWIPCALLAGLKEIRRNRPDVIVSTYPIASAHLVGYLLHKITGIPWIADFRDPMAQAGYPANNLVRKSFLWIEKLAAKHASKLVFVTDGAKDFYQNKYPQLLTGKCLVIPNGYDEEMFTGLGRDAARVASKGKRILLHSGVIYPHERNPVHLFEALATLKQHGTVSSENFSLVLRATGHDDVFKKMACEKQVDDLVDFAPSIPYREAIEEMFVADMLLLLQADDCDMQIPAKAYEYLRVGRPVLALTSMTGETGKLLAAHPQSLIAPLNDAAKIREALVMLLEDLATNNASSAKDVADLSRESGAHKLQEVLMEAASFN